jgi:hypothetical protein
MLFVVWTNDANNPTPSRLMSPTVDGNVNTPSDPKVTVLLIIKLPVMVKSPANVPVVFARALFALLKADCVNT